MKRNITLVGLIVSVAFLNTDIKASDDFKRQCLIDSLAMDALGYNNTHMAKNGELAVLQHYVKDGGIVFDVGANVGEWSESVLHFHPNAMIYAFEPIPALAENLCKKFRAKRVSVNQCAISCAEGTKQFDFYEHETGLSGLYHRPQVVQSLHQLPKRLVVKTLPLDVFCERNNIQCIDFLKIDTEGSEFDVLRGATRLLENKMISLLQFEYGGTYPDAGITLKQVYAFLTSKAYFIYRISSRNLIYIPEWRDALETYKYANYVASAVQL